MANNDGMQQIRLLFWLKTKLLLRGYVKSKSEWLGTLLMLFTFVPGSIAIAFVALFSYTTRAMPDKGHALELTLFGIYLFWLLIPIMGYSLSDGYDVTKLFVFPLSMRKLFTGVLLSSLLDRPVVLLMPLFLSILIGFSSGPLAILIAFPALVFFLFHTLALSQAILMTGSALFSSRKFRDTILLVLPLLWMVYYLRFVFNSQMRSTNWLEFTHTSLWQGILWLPPGWAAKAISYAHDGNYLLAITFLAGMGAFTVGTVYLASTLLTKVYSGDMIVAPGKSAVSTPPPINSKPFGLTRFGKNQKDDSPMSLPGSPALFRWMPPATLAIAGKEFRYLLRDPFYKMMLANLFWPVIILAITNNSQSQREMFAETPKAMSNSIVWAMASLMTFSQCQMPYNIFGTEGGAVNLLFLFPAPRKQIILGKNLFHFTMLSCVNLIFAIAASIMKGDLGLGGLVFAQIEMSLLVTMAIGNVFSLYFPVRVVMKGWKTFQRNSSQGCAFMLLYMLAFFGSFILILPIIAGLLLPTFEIFGIGASWLAVTVPAGAIYAMALYSLSVLFADKLIVRREEAIIAKISAEPASG